MGIFDEIDQIVNIDIGGRDVDKLYQAARSDLPLCKESAELIINSVKEDGSVGIASGFPIIPMMKPETDGPLGASILANCLDGLGASPFFVTDELNRRALLATAKSIGLDMDVECIPTEQEHAKDVCHEILKEYDPCLLISVERPGINPCGIYNNMNGEDITRYVGHVDHIFSEALKSSIPTIGIGDGGNEIGMGNIREALLKMDDEKMDVYCVTRTKSLIASAVSNWGAYSVVAAVSISKRCQFMHNADLEERMLKACVDSGAIDGITKKSELSIDGLSLELNKRIVGLLHSVVIDGLV
ncbi:MAG: DUF4392 domain-containing protein [Halobacteriota archaeon]|nr:DUF4392 domain-containing protein [Halobacteriota archaeon]